MVARNLLDPLGITAAEHFVRPPVLATARNLGRNAMFGVRQTGKQAAVKRTPESDRILSQRRAPLGCPSGEEIEDGVDHDMERFTCSSQQPAQLQSCRGPVRG